MRRKKRGNNMCDFISWIEKDGRLFYLTDREFFGPRGKELFGGDVSKQSNDPLGHGAIRLFYGTDNEPMAGGINREVHEFWRDGALPDELAVLIADFDLHWGRLWANESFQNDDLRRIIQHAPDEWKAKATEQFFKQGLGKVTFRDDDLRCIIDYAPDEWKAKAKEQLTKK
ncbi:MAG: hypothetical protein V1738_04480 [Patescibacteria group bacterium]